MATANDDTFTGGQKSGTFFGRLRNLGELNGAVKQHGVQCAHENVKTPSTIVKEDSMPQDSDSGRRTVSFEELAYSNMLIVQALVELLGEKGLLDSSEITQRVKKLRDSVEHVTHRRSSSTLNPPDHNHICIRCKGNFPCWKPDCDIAREFVCNGCSDDLSEGQPHSTPS